MEELKSSLEAAKNDLSEATVKLRAMIRAFKESRLLPQPGQFSGVYIHMHISVDVHVSVDHYYCNCSRFYTLYT